MNFCAVILKGTGRQLNFVVFHIGVDVTAININRNNSSSNRQCCISTQIDTNRELRTVEARQ